MRQDLIKLSAALLASATIVGCGGGSSDVDRDEPITPPDSDVIKLTPQTGTDSYLFFGNSDHTALGGLKTVRVLDSSNPSATLVSNDDTSDIRRPELTTSMGYDASTNSYTDLHADTLHYVSGNNPYKVAMKKGDATPTQAAQSSGTNMVGTGRGGAFSYTKIDYLGSKQYIMVEDSNGDKQLITPEMSATDAPLAFDNKTLLTLSYPSFGATATGYIVHDSNASGTGVEQIRNCTLDMKTCTAITDVNDGYKFIGDIGGTSFSAIEIDSKFYKLDKADNSMVELTIGDPTPMPGATAGKSIRAAASSYYFSGNSIYFIDSNHNISRYNIDTGDHKQISSDGKTDRIRAFSDDMVMYAPTDSEMYAVKKDGTSTTSLQLSVATTTSGQKYTYDMAVGGQYIYNLFNVNTDTGKTTFRACILEDAEVECKDDSTWAVVILAKDGKLNFESSVLYSPYAFVRIDNTDNYGGGTLKAIDPENPMKDGITMGTTETFNFQSFKTRTYALANSDGGVVLYAKNDLDFRSNAYYMNLNKENSLVNLSNENPPVISEINGGSGHCHGRYCTVCHSFAGGKIYKDKAGTGSAENHNIRFEFEDGSDSILAKIRKGEGENFNTPLKNLVGKNFKAVVVDENETEVVSSVGYYHNGVEYFNCNFCHRSGDLRHEAPNVISIED